ncbi:MAG TPA: zf-HC2 domain-containing protein [Candidatus Bathyarchaeia archaeon]|nr:zf-HC2 domain-containing protein [Candidatus Bathyarchaeia archaeon]
MPNECDQFQPMMSGHLDGELDEKSGEKLQKHLAECPRCSAEYQKLARIVAASDRLRLEIPPDEVWDSFLAGAYNKIERKTGWAAFVVGAVALVALGIWLFMMEPWASALVKILIAVPVVGLLIIFVSVLRERLFLAKVDRYSREIQR